MVFAGGGAGAELRGRSSPVAGRRAAATSSSDFTRGRVPNLLRLRGICRGGPAGAGVGAGRGVRREGGLAGRRLAGRAGNRAASSGGITGWGGGPRSNVGRVGRTAGAGREDGPGRGVGEGRGAGTARGLEAGRAGEAGAGRAGEAGVGRAGEAGAGRELTKEKRGCSAGKGLNVELNTKGALLGAGVAVKVRIGAGRKGLLGGRAVKDWAGPGEAGRGSSWKPDGVGRRGWGLPQEQEELWMWT